jgi:hypothetical protein
MRGGTATPAGSQQPNRQFHDRPAALNPRQNHIWVPASNPLRTTPAHAAGPVLQHRPSDTPTQALDRARRASDVFNISNFPRDLNPSVQRRCIARTGFDTWTMIAAYSRAPSSSIRVRTLLQVGAGVAADCLTSLPQRVCDRLFAINDAEAYWRGWQISRVQGGFGRRYRDPAFDSIGTLDEEEPATAA